MDKYRVVTPLYLFVHCFLLITLFKLTNAWHSNKLVLEDGHARLSGSAWDVIAISFQGSIIG